MNPELPPRAFPPSRPHVGMFGRSQALLATDQIIFGILVIGLIGLASDLLFKTVNRKVFAWAALGR